MFFGILQQMLQHVPVDEVWYLDRHRDVQEAVAAGAFASAKDHFVKHGYFEGKLPYAIPVDEAFYLDAYPDVREAIRTGAIASAQLHFLQSGYKEGRVPHAGFSLFTLDRGQHDPAAA
ncbi:hypothetical protein [Methylobacterium nonmethylotrophicum]|uniref:Uncharacterized protein n=1 Tax=Methylobacterium nonmethylotrophicum TaxID=1141884 RepID=A0A4Z0NTD2_9HYPH|nr:hypothetical protein [Methylobacterium nonmethylotrophicum]TGE00144.1 hypothetical protein EU555_09515 [Methylobacterium nonmethylotrophicum]